MKFSIRAKIISLLCSGLFTAAIGLVLYATFPSLMKYEIRQRLVLKEGSETYTYWKDIPAPIYIHFYFFNILNPDEIWNLTNKPELEELGPYTFREARKKVNITWNSNGTVSYRQIKTWYFQPDKTNGSLDDNVTTLNVPMIAAAAKAKQMNSTFVYYMMTNLFEYLNSTWFIQKSVRELLFEGYYDGILNASEPFMPIKMDKFGWFYGRNKTDDGEFVVYTGKDEVQKLDVVDTWNGNRSLRYYDPPCNRVNGTAGDMWPPVQDKRHKITMFIPDICRSMSLSYLKEKKIGGITSYRYWADKTVLDNGKYDPENKCFCTGDECLPAGAVNVSTCKFDAPAVVSYPHFLFADSSYLEGVIGLSPDPKSHTMYIDILPTLGVPVEVAARMQINIIFDKVEEILQFENITKRIVFPVLWFSETAEISKDILAKLRLLTRTLPILVDAISLALLAIGTLLVLASFVLAILYAIKAFSYPKTGTKESKIQQIKS